MRHKSAARGAAASTAPRAFKPARRGDLGTHRELAKTFKAIWVKRGQNLENEALSTHCTLKGEIKLATHTHCNV